MDLVVQNNFNVVELVVSDGGEQLILEVNALAPVGSGGGTTVNASWGGISGTLSNQTDLVAALNLKQNNVVTTKGDLIAGDSAGLAARLGVGADGLALVAASTAPLGVKWASISGGSGGSSPTIQMTQNFPLQQVAAVIASKAGTVNGVNGFGSSLFLQRLFLPGSMSLSEIQMALSIGFPATNQGAGTMSRSIVIYSFGNATSLASLISASGTSSWNTGTSTVGASVSLTQFQGGWSTPLIQPMTFNSSSLAAGEYVIGQLFDFSQASSTWTLNLYGANAVSSLLASAATNLTSASLGAMSSVGLLAGSVFTASNSSALTAFTAAPTPASVMSSAGLLAASAFTASGSSALTAFTVAPTAANVMGSAGLLAASAFTLSGSSALTAFTVAPTAANVMGSAGLLAASAFTASGSSAITAFTVAPTGVNVMSSNGLLAGSLFTASSSSSLTAWSAAPTAVNALSSTGLSDVSGVSGVSSYPAQFIAMSTAGSLTQFRIQGTVSTAASSQTISVSTLQVTATNTAKSVSIQIAGASSNSNIVSSIGVVAGSFHTASGSGAVLSNEGTSAFAGFMGSGGLLAGSFHTASGSGAVLSNAGTAVASLMASTGLLAGSFFTASGSSAVLSNAGTAAASLMGTAGLLAGSFFTNSGSNDVLSNAGTAAASLMGSSGLLAGSFFTASGSNNVLSNAGTAGASLLGSGGLLAGSFFTNSASIAAVTNVALGALNSSTVAQSTLPNFGYIGTGSTTSAYPSVFIAGVMSTGAIPANITLTSTAVTYSGSVAFMQPWFLLAA